MLINIRCRCGRCTPVESVSSGSRPTCPACGRVLVAPAARGLTAGPTTRPPILSPSSADGPAAPPPLPASPSPAWMPWRPSARRLALPALLGAGGGLVVLLAIALAWRGRAPRDTTAAAGEAPASAPRAPAPAPVASGRPLTTREIVERTEASVALIKGKSGSGSGFLIGPGTVATNSHVIRRELVRNIEVYFPSAAEAEKGPHRATLRYEDPRRDLAILSIGSNLPAIPMAKSHRFVRGEDVTIIGSPGLGPGPLVLQNAVCKGVLSSEMDIKGMHFFQLSASVNSGNSGGPAMDSTGEVIGIVTLKSITEEAIGFCIPIGDVASTLRRLEGQAGAGDPATARRHGVVAVYYGLNRLCELYASALSLYLARMTEAMQQGRPATEGFRAASQTIGEDLHEMEAGADDLRAELARLDDDATLAGETSRGLHDLSDAYADMKRLVERPQGSFESFRTRAFQAKDRFARAARKLEADLGVTSDE